jgi:hypothetical protein
LLSWAGGMLDRSGLPLDQWAQCRYGNLYNKLGCWKKSWSCTNSIELQTETQLCLDFPAPTLLCFTLLFLFTYLWAQRTSVCQLITFSASTLCLWTQIIGNPNRVSEDQECAFPWAQCAVYPVLWWLKSIVNQGQHRLVLFSLLRPPAVCAWMTPVFVQTGISVAHSKTESFPTTAKAKQFV